MSISAFCSISRFPINKGDSVMALPLQKNLLSLDNDREILYRGFWEFAGEPKETIIHGDSPQGIEGDYVFFMLIHKQYYQNLLILLNDHRAIFENLREWGVTVFCKALREKVMLDDRLTSITGNITTENATEFLSLVEKPPVVPPPDWLIDLRIIEYYISRLGICPTPITFSNADVIFPIYSQLHSPNLY